MNEDRIESLLRMYMPVSTHDDARRLALAVEREAYEAAAKVAWIHYMDTCKAQGIHPAEHEQWLCAAAIRRIKESP